MSGSPSISKGMHRARRAPPLRSSRRSETGPRWRSPTVARGGAYGTQDPAPVIRKGRGIRCGGRVLHDAKRYAHLPYRFDPRGEGGDMKRVKVSFEWEDA